MSESLSHRGFRAWISSDEGILPVYEPTISDETISAWLPSKPGQCFTVHWEDTGTGVLSASYIYLDGVCHPGRFLAGSGTASRCGVRVGVNVERRFLFANASDPMTSVAHPKKQASRYGKVELFILHVRKTGTTGTDTLLCIPDNKPDFAHPHRVTYGAGITTNARPDHTFSVEHVDPNKPSPVVKFVFRYRPIEFLVEQGVAPSSAIPSQPLAELSKKEGKQRAGSRVPSTSNRPSGSTRPTPEPSDGLPSMTHPSSPLSAGATTASTRPILSSDNPSPEMPTPLTSKAEGKRNATTPFNASASGPDDYVLPSPVSPKTGLKRTRRTTSSSSRKSRKTSAEQSPASAMLKSLGGAPPNFTPEQVQYIQGLLAQRATHVDQGFPASCEGAFGTPSP